MAGSGLTGFLQNFGGGEILLIVLAALVVVFAGRYAKTRKFMPSGMLIVLSAAADVALLYLQFAGPKA
jgi:uncharacterized membrane protein (UPF0136 family)